MRVVATVLAALLLATVLWAEGAGEPKGPAPTGPVPISIMSEGDPIPPDDVLVPIINKELGIELAFDGVPYGQYVTRLGVKIASGDIPNAFYAPLPSLVQYARQGLLLPLDKYSSQLGPVLKVTRDTDWGKVTVDGARYAIPKRPSLSFFSQWIRKDWLDNLGLAAPTSVEDLFKVAQAFTNNDPDGDGKRNTFGMAGLGFQTFNALFTAMESAGAGSLVLENGQPALASTTRAFRSALDTAKRFVDAGVVDPEIMAVTGHTQLLEKMASGRVGSVYYNWPGMVKTENLTALKAQNPKADWIQLPSLGKFGAEFDIGGNAYQFAIDGQLAKDGRKLGKVFALFNYVTEGPGYDLVSYGIEGTHYTRKDGRIAVTSALGYSWQLQLTGRNEMQYLIAKFGNLESYIKHAAAIPQIPIYNSLVVPPQGFNLADLKRFELEELIKFVYGQRPLSEYPDFVKQLQDTFKSATYIEASRKALLGYGFIK